MLARPEAIMAAIGYNIPADYPYQPYNNLLECSHVVLERLTHLMTQLAAIDEALDQAPLDSMATKVDKLEVNYASHVGILRSEGSRILNEIAFTIGAKVAFDRYRQTTTSRFFVTNYW